MFIILNLYLSHLYSLVSSTLDSVERRDLKGDKRTGSNATAISIDQGDSDIYGHDKSSDRVNLSTQSSSKPTIRSSEPYDGSMDHPVTSSIISSPTAQMRLTKETQGSPPSPNRSSDKKINVSVRSSISTDSTGMKEKQNDAETTSIPGHNPQQSSCNQTSSGVDARSVSKPSSYSSDYDQSPAAVKRHTQSDDSDDQNYKKARLPNSYGKLSSRDSIVAYIPYLPIDELMDKTLESTIANCLKSEYALQVVNIKCSLQLDIGIVYLRSKEDKNDLVNKIKKILIDPNSNRTVSFVDDLQLVSYVVCESKDITYCPSADSILQQWIKRYNHNTPLTCERIMRSIFEYISNSCKCI